MKPSMRQLYLLLVASLIAVICGRAGLAAEQGLTPHFLWIWEDQIEPSQMETYMKGRAEMASLAAAHKFDFSYLTYVKDFKVLSCGVFEQFAAVDSFQGKMVEYAKRTGGRSKVLDDQCAKCIRSSSSSIAAYRPDLSYLPKKPVFTPDYSKPFFMLTIAYHVKPGKFEKAVEIAGKIKKLYEDSEIPGGYLVYEKICGQDVPTFYGVICVKDKARLLEGKKDKEDLTPFEVESEKLFGENLDILTGVDVFEWEYVPAISYAR